jgi:hypothetical protein
VSLATNCASGHERKRTLHCIPTAIQENDLLNEQKQQQRYGSRQLHFCSALWMQTIFWHVTGISQVHAVGFVCNFWWHAIAQIDELCPQGIESRLQTLVAGTLCLSQHFVSRLIALSQVLLSSPQAVQGFPAHVKRLKCLRVDLHQ